VEATSAAGAVVSWSAITATDAVDGTDPVSCSPASGSTFALGQTTVTCTSTDAHSNTSSHSFKVTVQDTTPPVVTVPTDITVTASSSAGATVTFTATATDIVDGPVVPVCTPASGSLFAPGTTTVSCTATDAHHNASAAKTFKVTVVYKFIGFLSPLNSDSSIVNVGNSGRVYPVKWQLQDQNNNYVTNAASGTIIRVDKISCTDLSGAPTDAIDYSASAGDTTVRYDSTANQYIYNWATPGTKNSCYRLTVTTPDGTAHTALFNLK
jgi:hypothetical protein